MGYVDEVRTMGFAVLPALFAEDAVDRLLVEAQALQSRISTARGGIRNLLSVSSMRSLATGDELMRIVRAVIGSEARVVRGILFDKTPNANWKVPWHQDVTIAVKERRDTNGYGPWSVKDGVIHVQPPAEILEQMFSVRIHLDDCPASNGALRVVPASHLRGKVCASEVERLCLEAQDLICEVPAGGAMLMRPLLFHASSASTEPGHRRVLHFDYAACELSNGLCWYEQAMP